MSLNLIPRYRTVVPHAYHEPVAGVYLRRGNWDVKFGPSIAIRAASGLASVAIQQAA